MVLMCNIEYCSFVMMFEYFSRKYCPIFFDMITAPKMWYAWWCWWCNVHRNPQPPNAIQTTWLSCLVRQCFAPLSKQDTFVNIRICHMGMRSNQTPFPAHQYGELRPKYGASWLRVAWKVHWFVFEYGFWYQIANICIFEIILFRKLIPGLAFFRLCQLAWILSIIGSAYILRCNFNCMRAWRRIVAVALPAPWPVCFLMRRCLKTWTI